MRDYVCSCQEEEGFSSRNSIFEWLGEIPRCPSFRGEKRRLKVKWAEDVGNMGEEARGGGRNLNLVPSALSAPPPQRAEVPTYFGAP